MPWGMVGRMRKPGMAELAAAAGVSMATVDRALNGRQKVHRDTVNHLAAVARAIGHPAAVRLSGFHAPAPGLKLRLGVVLHKQGQDFYKAFAAELARAVAAETRVQAELVLEFSGSQGPSDMAAHMRAMAGRCDVLAATAVNHPEVAEAVEDLAAQGIRTVTLLSEFGEGMRAGYVGLDNYRMGRTAGWSIAQSARAAGSVAVFIGGQRWHGHALRDQGIRDFLREKAPHLRVLETRVNLETRALTQDAVARLLRGEPDLRGIYVAGGGMEGAIAALREGRAGGRVALVVSALTPVSRQALIDGLATLVIDTPLELLCRRLIARMHALATGAPFDGPDQEFLLPALFLPESL